MNFHNLFEKNIINLEKCVSTENNTFVFAFDISKIKLSEIKWEIFNLLTEERVKQIESRKNSLSQKQMICCDALLMFSIKKIYHIDYRQSDFDMNNFNIIKIDNKQTIYFNKSHSKDMICCAISNKPVGIDIQEHKKTNKHRIAEQFYSIHENNMLEKENFNSKMFFDIWCKKESYLKMKGIGLNKTLSKLDYLNCKFNFVDIFKNYSLCLCECLNS